jgi:hypothetical protein
MNKEIIRLAQNNNLRNLRKKMNKVCLFSKINCSFVIIFILET